MPLNIGRRGSCPVGVRMPAKEGLSSPSELNGVQALKTLCVIQVGTKDELASLVSDLRGGCISLKWNARLSKYVQMEPLERN